LAIRSEALSVSYHYVFRGNGTLALQPQADDLNWSVTAPWGSPSFKGDFLPQTKHISDKQFDATWRIGGLSLGAGEGQVGPAASAVDGASRSSYTPTPSTREARVELFEPVDIYSQVERATKYGFLFVGFTFMAFLMFDIIGGVRVSIVEYLLVGAGLVMFFVLLLALSEVTGFPAAYLLASGGIIGLITAYSAAVLKSWDRAKWVGGLLGGLYAALYVLLSLEDYALLIGALMLFSALAGVMYLTRNIDWSGKRVEEEAV
jgi:inner membrane protein